MANPQRLKFVIDDDACFEECNGERRPLTEEEYADAPYMANGHPISYADYLNYQGNPDRHVYLGMIVQEQCLTCSEWHNVDSLWRIDLMDDDPEYLAVAGKLDQWIDSATATQMLGYLGELARDAQLEVRL